MTMINRYMVNTLIRSNLFHKWVKVLKNGPSKIYGRQPLSSINFTWSILEYLDPNPHIRKTVDYIVLFLHKCLTRRNGTEKLCNKLTNLPSYLMYKDSDIRYPN